MSRARPIHPRGPLLGGHDPARPGRPRASSTAASSAGSSRTRCRRARACEYLEARIGASASARSARRAEARRQADVEHVRLGRERRRDRGEGSRRRRHGRQRADGRHGPPAGWRPSPMPRARRSASGSRTSTAAREVINEHGGVNFNDLNTRDLEAREGLLRRRLRLGGAGDGGRLLRCGACPATATSSRSSTPACARACARWAPPSASRTSSPPSLPIPADQPDTPAHWSVTFAVDDADEAAAKAAELGGTVVEPPTHMPLGADDGDHRPPGSDVHGEQVRAALLTSTPLERRPCSKDRLVRRQDARHKH